MAKMMLSQVALESHALYKGNKPCACCWTLSGASGPHNRKAQTRKRQTERQIQRTREKRRWKNEIVESFEDF